MNVVLDNNALVLMLNPKAPRDMKARLKGLLQDTEKTRSQVLIPTPVLTEYLSHALEAELRQKLMEAFRNSRWVRVVPYDELASDECAAMHIRAMAEGDKRTPLPPTTPWQAVKIDRQIVAIAKVRTAYIVTGDSDVAKVAAWANIKAIKVTDLVIPESERQLMIGGGLEPAGARTSRARPEVGLKRVPNAMLASNDPGK